MNDKEKELWRVIDNVIKCCAIELPSGELSQQRQNAELIAALKTTTTTTGA